MTRPARADVAAGVVAIALAVVLLLVVAPDRLSAHGTAPFAQLVALRGLVAVGLAVVALVLAAVPWRRRLLPVTAVVGLALVVQLGVIVDRGVHAPGADADADAGETLVVLTLNTQGHLAPDALAAFLVEHRPDVAVLPETLSTTAGDAAELAAAHGLDLQVLASDRGTTGGPAATGATAMLVHRRLGDYRVVSEHAGALASFTAAGPGDGPTVSAVHPYPPLPGVMADWRAEAAAAVALCDEVGGIVAGDVNATLDHPAFDGPRRCVDAAEAVGAAGLGTWPVRLPSVLAAPIDHVLVDGDAWHVLGVSVLEPPAGTDHRAVLVRLAPAG